MTGIEDVLGIEGEERGIEKTTDRESLNNLHQLQFSGCAVTELKHCTNALTLCA